MTFLNTGLLAAGLGAVAIPILIHLLMRRRRQPVRWAAMRVLVEAYRQHKRRLKLVTQGHHLTQARKTGLTTLPKVFVMSMEKAGLSWGTHFPSGADMMHFATPGQP